MKTGRGGLDQTQHEGSPVPIRVERAGRLRRDFGGQVRPARYVGQVRADQVELSRQRIEEVAAGHVHPVAQAVARDVARCDLERVTADIARPYLDSWRVVRDRDR